MRAAWGPCAALLLTAISVQPAYAAPARDSVIEALGHRLFPVLTAIDPASASEALAKMRAERRLRTAACGADAPCTIRAVLWSDQEIALVANFASTLNKPAMAVRRELLGLNAILTIYGAGAAPRYPEIDGPIGAAGSPRLANDVAAAIALAQSGQDEPIAALDPSLGLALALLDVNDRLDAIAFEPLESGENLAPFQRAKSTDWAHYRFSAIIVLGVGPDDRDMALSARGKLNVRLAAQSYFAGDAPFLIVSGSHVHPRGNPYLEAVEMRRALIERYKVPPEAIVLEPHARHTTTNLRNATRLLMAMGAPLTREAVIIANAAHSTSIENAEFKNRNQRELGYQPGKIGQRLSPFALTFLPSTDSALVDPNDPLDP